VSDKSIEFVFFTFVIYAFAAFFSAIAPPTYQIFNTYGIIYSAGGMLGVTAACVVATGLPCAAALVIYGVSSIFLNGYLTGFSTISYVQSLFFLPLSGVFIYIVLKLARGVS